LAADVFGEDRQSVSGVPASAAWLWASGSGGGGGISTSVLGIMTTSVEWRIESTAGSPVVAGSPWRLAAEIDRGVLHVLVCAELAVDLDHALKLEPMERLDRNDLFLTCVIISTTAAFLGSAGEPPRQLPEPLRS
jgi:hypothetical protein